MTAQVLMAYDGSPAATHAIECVAQLMAGSSVRVVTVWRSSRQAAQAARLALPDDVIEGGTRALDEQTARDATKLAGEGAALAGDAGLGAAPIALEAESTVWAAILEMAKSERADVVVLGTRGRSGVKAALLGSVSQAVLRHAERPVMVVPEPAGDRRDGPVVIGFDGSADSEAAIRAAADLLPGRAALILHAWEPINTMMLAGSALDPYAGAQAAEVSRDIDRRSEENAQELADSGVALARDAGLEATACAVPADRGVWQTVVEEAGRRRAALVVVASRGRGRTASVLLGSVSRGVVHHAEAPVLVVPPAD